MLNTVYSKSKGRWHIFEFWEVWMHAVPSTDYLRSDCSTCFDSVIFASWKIQITMTAKIVSPTSSEDPHTTLPEPRRSFKIWFKRKSWIFLLVKDSPEVSWKTLTKLICAVLNQDSFSCPNSPWRQHMFPHRSLTKKKKIQVVVLNQTLNIPLCLGGLHQTTVSHVVDFGSNVSV